MTRRRLLIATLILLALLAYAWFAAGARPAWYAPANPADAAVEQASERLEFRVQQELQRIRDGQSRWTLRFGDDVINDWLATRLRPWLDGQAIDWPDGVGVPQVRCGGGVIEVAAPVSRLNDRVGRIDLLPVLADARVRLQPAGCGVGRLPIGLPSSLVLPDLGEIPLMGSPVAARLDLIDDRHVQIVAIRPVSGALEVDLVTLGPAVP